LFMSTNCNKKRLASVKFISNIVKSFQKLSFLDDSQLNHFDSSQSFPTFFFKFNDAFCLGAE
jgi:hypothetical protein